MCHAVRFRSDLDALLERATVVVLGPGLGRSTWSEALWARVLDADCPLLVDADGLNLLAARPQRREDWVLTPHPGEAAKLLGLSIAEVEADRPAAVVALQARYGGTVVLKGAGSLVQSGEGPPKLCPLGNPGMAGGGMGDVLSGVIGALLAQGLAASAATSLGVCLHAAAADWAAEAEGERGLLATDLMPELRRLVSH
jgi:NAD(P)H-hydrate epimerase